FCRDGYAHLVEFIDRLNALQCKLSWRSLGEVVRCSCRQREISPGIVEMEMYGTQLQIINSAEQRKRFLVRRRESEPSAIKEIRIGHRPVAWNCSDGFVRFETELNPKETTRVDIAFHAP